MSHHSLSTCTSLLPLLPLALAPTTPITLPPLMRLLLLLSPQTPLLLLSLPRGCSYWGSETKNATFTDGTALLPRAPMIPSGRTIPSHPIAPIR